MVSGVLIVVAFLPAELESQGRSILCKFVLIFLQNRYIEMTEHVNSVLLGMNVLQIIERNIVSHSYIWIFMILSLFQSSFSTLGLSQFLLETFVFAP